MKLSKLKALIPDFDMVAADDLDVNPTEVLEGYFFRKPLSPKSLEGYRERAIRFSLDNHLPLIVTANNVYEMARTFVVIKCPCGRDMEQFGGSGNGSEYTIRYSCTCGNKLNFSTPVGGIVFFPKGGK